ncbi:MAG: hypothetical protein ACRDO9_11255, partial [Gaiellales bacterium]
AVAPPEAHGGWRALLTVGDEDAEDVKQAGSMAGYSRATFGPAWEDVDMPGLIHRRGHALRVRRAPGIGCPAVA